MVIVKRTKISAILAAIGVCSGLCIITLALVLKDHDATQLLKEHEKDQPHTILISYRQIYQIFLWILLTGCFQETGRNSE
jgi:hypothetical protein